MSVSEVRLYVKSAKTVTGTVEEDIIHSQLSAGRGEILLPPMTKIGPEREYILPEDHRELLKSSRMPHPDTVCKLKSSTWAGKTLARAPQGDPRGARKDKDFPSPDG